MTSIEKLKLNDVKKKNILVMMAFPVSILAALILTIVQESHGKSIFYGIELTAVIGSFLAIKFLLKKEMLFKYVLVVLVYGFVISFIIMFDGAIATAFIIFFLLMLSTVHLTQSVFLFGYVSGFVALYLNGTVGSSAEVTTLNENMAAVLLVYALAGFLSLILIHLNNRQFNQIEQLLVNSENDATAQEKARQELENNVERIIGKIATVNGNVQENIASQTEMSEAINEVAAGSMDQN